MKLNNFYEKLENLQCNKTEMRKDTFIYAESLLNNIDLKIDDYKCYQQMYKLLIYTHYNKFIRSNMILLTNNSFYPLINKTIYNFVIGVYSICYKCQMFNSIDIDSPLNKIYANKISVNQSIV